MLKQDNVAIAASNIANYGSQMHEDAKEAKANAEVEFVGAGKDVGIEIWRIENFGVKPYPKEHYGTFYAGDSFLVLSTYKKNPSSNALSWDLHFWLGKDSTRDEMGTAAFKAVELDDLLRGAPVQYREVQDSESAEFLKLFPNGIKLLDGGVSSGFTEVKAAEYRPRLLHIKQSKNKKSIRVSEVPLARSSLNEGDVFIVDNGLQLYQFNGSSAGVFEKRRGVELVESLKQERLGKPKTSAVDSSDADDAFWALVGGRGAVPAAIPDTEEPDASEIVLVRVSDSTGELKSEEIGRAKSDGKLSRALLTSDDVFILDLINTLFVYIGKGCTKAEKSSGMKFALDYLVSKNRPNNIPISRIVEGGEPDSFLKAFN